MVESLTGEIRILRLVTSGTWMGSKWKALAPWEGGPGGSPGCSAGASGSFCRAEPAGGGEKVRACVVSQGQARVSVISQEEEL